MSTDHPTRLTRVGDSTKPGFGMYRCSHNGNVKEYNDKNVSNGNTKSCGCIKRELMILRNTLTKTKHGRAGTPLYQVWQSAKQRCVNPGHKKWDLYGGRGITMCSHLQESFDNFITAVGERPGPGDTYSIDRADNNLGYWCGRPDCADCGPKKQPYNLRWVTRRGSANNRSTNHPITWRGRTMTIAEWGRELGMPPNVIRARVLAEWDTDAVLTTPIRSYTSKSDEGGAK